MSERKSLAAILQQGGTETLTKQWNETAAAADLEPIPAGVYECRIASGELFTSKNGTPGYKLTFRVLDGDLAGRLVFEDLWLTPAALPMTKRDLAKIAITDVRQLEDPVPPGLRCKVKVALRRDDDGSEYNRVRGFELIAWDKTDDPDFGPADTPAQADTPADPPTPETAAPPDPSPPGTWDPVDVDEDEDEGHLF